MQVRRMVSSVLTAGMVAAFMTGGAVLADDGAMELTVVERATTDAIIDVGEPGDTIGDLLAFGSTTGNLYASDDRGDSWHTVGNNFPPIYSVRFA